MRIYISGVISGTTDYLQRFSDAETYLAKQGYIVINPARVLNEMPKDTDHEEYMILGMAMLGMCDSIYMLRGWEKSCGANREYGYALAKDLKIIFEEGETP